MVKSSENVPPIYQGSRIRGTIRWIFRRTTPFEGLVTIRTKFLGLFQSLYHSSPELKRSLSRWDNPTLVQKAVEARDEARHFDPHEPVEDLVGLFKFIQSIILAVLASLTVFSFLLGFSLYPLFRDLFSVASAPLSFLPTVVLALGWLYLGLLRWNRDALQVFNERLSVPKGQIHRMSRKRPDLVSYYIWNKVLQGQKIPTIVCGLYLLNQVAELPVLRRYFDDPAGFILNEIGDHHDELTEGDGYISAIWSIFKKKRE